MKKDLKKDLMIQKAMDALEKQALQDKETKNIKGGLDFGPILYGMYIP